MATTEAEVVVPKTKGRLSVPEWLLPFGTRTSNQMIVFRLLCAAVIFLGWQLLSGALIPGPLDTLQGIGTLFQKGLHEYYIESLITLVTSLVLGFVFSVVFAHLGTIPFFRPYAEFVGSLRVLSMAPLVMWAVFLGIQGNERKIGLMVLFITAYSVPSILQIFDAISEKEKDYYRTLRCSPLMAWWQMTVRARMPQVIAVYVINMGMAINMLPALEALLKTQGGIGVLIGSAERDMNFTEIMAGTVILLASGWLIFKLTILAVAWKWPKAWAKINGGK